MTHPLKKILDSQGLSIDLGFTRQSSKQRNRTGGREASLRSPQ
jgi:hypothetical protein